MSLSKAANRREGDKATPGLNLAAMIDIFTVLLIFLILTFVADEQSFEIASDAELPKASAELKNLPKIQVQISEDGTYALDGEKADNSQMLITRLKQKAAQDEVILLVADQRLSFEKIDRAVAILTKAGFTEFQFLTAQQEDRE